MEIKIAATDYCHAYFRKKTVTSAGDTFCPSQSSLSVRHSLALIQLSCFLTFLAISVMPDGTVVLGAYIGSDQHKFRDL